MNSILLGSASSFATSAVRSFLAAFQSCSCSGSEGRGVRQHHLVVSPHNRAAAALTRGGAARACCGALLAAGGWREWRGVAGWGPRRRRRRVGGADFCGRGWTAAVCCGGGQPAAAEGRGLGEGRTPSASAMASAAWTGQRLRRQGCAEGWGGARGAWGGRIRRQKRLWQRRRGAQCGAAPPGELVCAGPPQALGQKQRRGQQFGPMQQKRSKLPSAAAKIEFDVSCGPQSARSHAPGTTPHDAPAPI